MQTGSKLTSVEIEPNGEVSFFFEGSYHPWSVTEFVAGSKTHKLLSKLESRIREFNKEGCN